MTAQAPNPTPQERQSFFRKFSVFLIGFFLIITLLTAFIVVPQINKSLETQHLVDSQITLKIEKELFIRFVNSERERLEDFARFPVIISAALLSSADNPDFIDLVENFIIAGEKSRLTLKNIAGEVIYETKEDVKASYDVNSAWVKEVMEGTIPYNFMLIGQEGDRFRFALSIPIMYLGNIEGILSAEMTAPLTAIFSPQTIKQGEGFKLKQNDVTIQTDTSSIAIPREFSIDVPLKNVKLTYISDDTKVIGQQNKLRNTILTTLLVGLLISFFLFSILEYQIQGRNDDKKFTLPGNIYITPLVIGGIGLTASITAALLLHNIETQKITQDSRAKNNEHVTKIESTIKAKKEILNSLKAFYDASDFVSRDEFREFTTPLLKDQTGIQALEWVPKILKSERDDYERQALKDGFTNFKIIEPNSNTGQLEPAPERDIHFPVLYAEPLEGNEKILGLDSPDNQGRAEAIRYAATTGEIAASKAFHLAQNIGDQKGVLIFAPIYYKDQALKTGEIEIFKNLHGLVLMALKSADTINHALGEESQTSSLLIEDVTNPSDPEIIYKNFNHEIISSTAISRTMNLGPRKWRICAFTNPKTFNTYKSYLPWLVFIGGSIFTLFITYTLIQLIRRRQIIEKVVEQRTREIQDAKQFQDTIMSNIPDLLFVKDEQFRIVEANPAFLNVYPENMRDSVIGTTTLEKYDKEEADGFLKHDKAALKDGFSETEEKITFPDGKTRTLFTKKVRFANRNNESFILGIGRDITDKKKAEEEILRSNVELERFAYVASHDLQEPLRMVTNFTSLLKERYENKLDDTAKEYIDFAFDGARRMQDLVNDLLEYSRLGQEAENSKDTDIEKILKLLEDNLKESIKESGAILTYEEMPTVYANPVRLLRVLQNLVGNGIKYQKPGNTPEILIETKEQEDTWLISVKDNGIGMKAEYCEKIFEPFKRLHARNEYMGTGMGLAICRKIIEGFGGKIWVEAEPDKGSKFYFTIPKTKKAGIKHNG